MGPGMFDDLGVFLILGTSALLCLVILAFVSIFVTVQMWWAIPIMIALCFLVREIY